MQNMKEFELSPNEIQELKAAHSSASKKRLIKHAYKINAVILLGTGWTAEEVSEALLLDKNTLGTYVRNYKSRGLHGLLQTHYKGGPSKLSTEQRIELKNHLSEYTYSDSKEIKKPFDIFKRLLVIP